MGDLFDLIGGLKLRDVGIEQVAETTGLGLSRQWP